MHEHEHVPFVYVPFVYGLNTWSSNATDTSALEPKCLGQCNASKCKFMHLGNGNSKFSYFMGDHKLESMNEEKDLGIFITDNLKRTWQCLQAYSKASKALGLIGRILQKQRRATQTVQDFGSSTFRILQLRLVAILWERQILTGACTKHLPEWFLD